MAPPREPSPPPHPAREAFAAISDGRNLAKAEDKRGDGLQSLDGEEFVLTWGTKTAFSRSQEAVGQGAALESQSSWHGGWAESRDGDSGGFACRPSRPQPQWNCDAGSWQQDSWKAQEASQEHHVRGREATDSEAPSQQGSWKAQKDSHEHHVRGREAIHFEAYSQQTSWKAQKASHKHPVHRRAAIGFEGDSQKAPWKAQKPSHEYHVRGSAATECESRSQQGPWKAQKASHEHHVDGRAATEFEGHSQQGPWKAQKPSHKHHVNGRAAAELEGRSQQGPWKAHKASHEPHVNGRAATEFEGHSQQGPWKAQKASHKHHVNARAATEFEGHSQLDPWKAQCPWKAQEPSYDSASPSDWQNTSSSWSWRNDSTSDAWHSHRSGAVRLPRKKDADARHCRRKPKLPESSMEQDEAVLSGQRKVYLREAEESSCQRTIQEPALAQEPSRQGKALPQEAEEPSSQREAPDAASVQEPSGQRGSRLQEAFIGTPSEPEHEQTPECALQASLDGSTLLAAAVESVLAQASDDEERGAPSTSGHQACDEDPALLPTPGHQWLVSEPGHPGHELGSVVVLGEGSLVFGDHGILASEEYGAVPVQLVRDEDVHMYVEEKMKHMVCFEQRWVEHSRRSEVGEAEA